MKKKFVYLILFIVVTILLFLSYICFFAPSTPTVTSVILNDKNNIVVKYKIPKYKYFKDVDCLLSTKKDLPSLDDSSWTKAINGMCSYPILDKTYYLFLKSNDKIIYVKEATSLGKVLSIEINKEKLFLAVNDTYKASVTYKVVGNIDNKITWKSENESIASVDGEGNIKGISNGNTNIVATMADKSVSTNVTVTKLLVSRPKSYDYKKGYLGCGLYSKDDNDLLDTILEERVKEKGYATRAGVVEAARFLTLELPFRISYFSENGRMAFRDSKVDGEGRYYHKGLYLDESRFNVIKYKRQGPETWGCNMYNNVSHRTSRNGFDCSGFVSWVLLNGGFDPGDIGAGVTSVYDLTDTGKKIKFNQKVVDSNVVKVGDLLSSPNASGGHIAIIVGMDKTYYYVAESLWTGKYTGVVIMPYKKNTAYNRYYWVMLMDDYYKEDGNYSELWY